MATERLTVKPGANFDPTNPAHLEAVLKNIAEKTSHGNGWKMQSFNPDDQSITLTRQAAVNQVAKSTKATDSYDVGLRAGTKPTDGDQIAAQLESDPRHSGYIMTSFEPFLGQATLSKMNPDTVRARGAFAVALGVKPWDVHVAPRADGGYSLKLPRSYVPSKHDDKLGEVAEQVVGKEGWFVSVNAQQLTAEVIPSDPPTFPSAIPYPVARLKNADLMLTPFGVKLPTNGDDKLHEAAIDWTASAFALVGGTPGSGKALPLTTRVPVPITKRFPDGWATIGELRLGDRVFVRSGETALVDYLSPVTTPDLIEMTFSDGQTILSDPEHLWPVSTAVTRTDHARRSSVPQVSPDSLRALAAKLHRGQVATSRQLADAVGVNPEEARRFAQSMNLPSEMRAPAPDEPRAVIKGVRPVVRVWPADEFLHAYAAHLDADRARTALLQLRTSQEILDSFNDAPSYAVPIADAVHGVETSFVVEPYAFGASYGGADEIPAAYLRASLEQRLEMLRGLMDENGSVANTGVYTLRLPAQNLPASVLELLCTLGTDIRTPKNAEGHYEQLEFATGLTVFRNATKLSSVPEAAPAPERWNHIVLVRQVHAAEVQCIRVNHPEHLFLIEWFVPTHNTVTLNALIAGSLAAGSELCIVDEMSKSIDFRDFKHFVRDGGWGCASMAAAVATLAMVYEEGQQRAKYLEANNVVNWLELPESRRFKPILVVVDEMSALVVADKPPAGIPKDHPLYLEAAENALLAASIMSYITKIISQQRFVGMRMILSTQITNASTGVGPSVRGKIGHKILQGSNPSQAQRKQSFSDDTAVPNIPGNVRADAKVAKGTGAAELEGQPPFIYKSYYASSADYRKVLLEMGLPQTTRPEPTRAEIAKFAPIEDLGEEPKSRMREEVGGFGRNEKRAPREDGLTGAAAAAHDAAVEEAAAKRARSITVPPAAG